MYGVICSPQLQTSDFWNTRCLVWVVETWWVATLSYPCLRIFRGSSRQRNTRKSLTRGILCHGMHERFTLFFLKRCLPKLLLDLQFGSWEETLNTFQYYSDCLQKESQINMSTWFRYEDGMSLSLLKGTCRNCACRKEQLLHLHSIYSIGLRPTTVN